MNEKKQFLFLDVGLGAIDELAVKLQEALRACGAQVEELRLAGNYDAVLDRLQDGAIPVVFKR